MSSFVSGFFHLVWCFQGSSMLWYPVSTSSFFLSNNIPLYGYTTFCSFIHQPNDIWLVFTFWLLEIILLWTFICKFVVNACFHFSSHNKHSIYILDTSLLLDIYDFQKIFFHSGLSFHFLDGIVCKTEVFNYDVSLKALSF